MTDSGGGGGVDVDELRAVVDAIAAKGGETGDQRVRRLVGDVIRGLGGEVSKPIRALIRDKIHADDQVRDLGRALDDLRGRYTRQQRAQDRLQELARELAQQNKTMRAQYEEQFETQRSQQESLRQGFHSSMAEIEERIRVSAAEQDATRRHQDDLQARIRAVLDLDAKQRDAHTQQMALKDDEIAVLKQAVAQAQADTAAAMDRAQAATAQIQAYAARFDQLQTSMTDNARAFQDLKRHVSNANHKNKAVMKENGRLAAQLEAKDRELGAVRAQFEKFLRRAAQQQSDKPPPPADQPGTADADAAS